MLASVVLNLAMCFMMDLFCHVLNMMNCSTGVSLHSNREWIRELTLDSAHAYIRYLEIEQSAFFIEMICSKYSTTVLF